MRILKFGGKSLETIEKTQKICKYIKKIYKKDQKIIVVVSAMGNTTDKLISCVKNFSIDNPAPRDYDALLSSGENISCSLISIVLNSMGIKAKSFQGWQIKIKTKGGFQNSLVYHIDKRKIEKCLETGTIAVIAGFQGVNRQNEITTLGRGGSDTTACALGATFNTDVELYSDFNGIYTGNPRLKPFKKLNQISIFQMQDMASSGAKVICDRAVSIAANHKINILAKSSTSPQNKGTIINAIETNKIAITEKDNLCQISVIFANESIARNMVKNVFICIKKYKFYNFNTKNNIIEFFVNTEDKSKIIQTISEKFHLLKNV